MFVGHRDADVIEAVQEAVLCCRVHRERLDNARRRDLDIQLLDINDDFGFMVGIDRCPDGLDRRF